MIIKDIFYGFQGEGELIGYPQIFIRFYGCNVPCDCCKDPNFDRKKHTYTVDQVMAELAPLVLKRPHSIAITGGEPLLQVDALKYLLPRLPIPAYLDTNGTLPSHLSEVVEWFEYFSVDYKPGFDREFADVMTLLTGQKNVVVKWGLTKGFPVLDLKKMVATVATVAPDVPFIIQPDMPVGGVKDKSLAEDIERAYNFAHQKLANVRVIPHAHKRVRLK